MHVYYKTLNMIIIFGYFKTSLFISRFSRYLNIKFARTLKVISI